MPALVGALALAGLAASCARPVVDADELGARGPLPEAVGEPWDDSAEWDEGAEWDEWDDGAGWGDGAAWDEWDDDSEWDDDAEPLASFSIDGDGLDPGDAPPDVAASAAGIWRRFTELIPADQRTMLDGFELLPESYGGAHVYPSDRDPSRWIMGIGLGLRDELDATLIHEFGHLLTLQAKEVPPGSDGRGCTTYFTGEGCALSGSTFADYVKQFWPEHLIDEVAELEHSGDQDAADAFYERHRDAFVTDYATTNPAEDLAETFTAFVMGERPGGSTIAEQKIAFLWDDPDMVTLRDRLRAAL